MISRCVLVCVCMCGLSLPRVPLCSAVIEEEWSCVCQRAYLGRSLTHNPTTAVIPPLSPPLRRPGASVPSESVRLCVICKSLLESKAIHGGVLNEVPLLPPFAVAAARPGLPAKAGLQQRSLSVSNQARAAR